MSHKYFLIPANFLTFDFEKLFDEYTARNSKVFWQLNNNDPQNMEKEDVCYLYYSNLPDNTKRIILRGIIEETNLKDKDSSGHEISCFSLSNLETINWKNSGRTKFTYDILHNEYGINITRNKRQLKDNRNGDKKLRENLESYFKRDNSRLNLEQLKEELGIKLRCAFNSSEIDPMGSKYHTTFKAKNGLNFFEVHHLFQQHICKKEESLSEAVYHEKNLIYLCPTCHKKIHYGANADVRKMLTTLYNREHDFYDQSFQKYAGSKGVLECLFEMYHVREDR